MVNCGWFNFTGCPSSFHSVVGEGSPTLSQKQLNCSPVLMQPEEDRMSGATVNDKIYVKGMVVLILFISTMKYLNFAHFPTNANVIHYEIFIAYRNILYVVYVVLAF